MVLNGGVLSFLRMVWRRHAVGTNSNTPVRPHGIGAPAAAVTRYLAQCIKQVSQGECAPLSLCHICNTPTRKKKYRAPSGLSKIRQRPTGPAARE